MLFSGAPGCGKTTLSKKTASIGGMDFVQVPPDSIKGYKETVDILGSINHDGYNRNGDIVGQIKPTILFIDEIHRLPIVGQEKLGIAMEDFQIESDRDKNRVIWFPLFTVIGATTEEGMLSKPFRDRFKLNFTFNLYDVSTMTKIVAFHANKIGIPVTEKACIDIAKRSRGTPRIGVKYLERARDYALYIAADVVNDSVTTEMFRQLGINDIGLNENETKLLKALYEIKMPVGIDNLAVITNVSQKTISDSIEPFLISKGLIVRSGRGRTLTHKGVDYVREQLIAEKDVREKSEIKIGYNRKL
jgi:Holliday junction DNA helicase RuvB